MHCLIITHSHCKGRRSQPTPGALCASWELRLHLCHCSPVLQGLRRVPAPQVLGARTGVISLCSQNTGGVRFCVLLPVRSVIPPTKVCFSCSLDWLSHSFLYSQSMSFSSPRKIRTQNGSQIQGFLRNLLNENYVSKLLNLKH